MAELMVDLDNGCMTVTLNRPDVYNAMSFAMYDALYQACERADDDPDVRVMVLRGAGGKAFVAGTDIGQLRRYASAEGGQRYEARLETILTRLEQVTVPVIALVEGVAAGAGLLLVLIADLCLCTPQSRFGAPMARTLGNCLSLRNCLRLAQALGARRAKALLMSAAMVDAAEAERLGLVHEVVTAQAAEARLADLTQTLMQHAPLSMLAYKRAFTRLPHQLPLPDDADIISRCYGSDDFSEGIQAFEEKRKPRWKGQ